MNKYYFHVLASGVLFLCASVGIAQEIPSAEKTVEQQPQESSEKLMQSGIQLYRNGLFDEAESFFQKVLKQEPNHADAMVYLARTRDARQKQKLRESKEDRLENAKQLFEESRYADASDVLTELLEADPLNKEIQKWLNRVRRAHYKKKMIEHNLKQNMEFEERILEVERASIPYMEPRKIANTTQQNKFVEEIEDQEDSEEVRKFRAELADVFVSLDFKNADLREVVRYLAEISDINIVIDESALLKTAMSSISEQTTLTQTNSTQTDPYAQQQTPTRSAGMGDSAFPNDSQSQTTRPSAPSSSIPGMDDVPSSEATGQSTQNPNNSQYSGLGATGEPVYVAPKLPDMYSPKVTVYLRHIPLLKALDIILRSKGLSYSLDEDFIWITTAHNMSLEKMVTRVYTIKHAVGRFASFKASPLDASILSRSTESGYSNIDDLFKNSSSSEDSVNSALSSLESASAKKSEEEVAGDLVNTLKQVVPQPTGSSMTLYLRTGKLIVRNTPRNLKALEGLLNSLDVSSLQVSLEVRILEVSDLEGTDLGVDFSMGETSDEETKSTSISSTNGLLGFGDALLTNATDGLNFSYNKLEPDELSVTLQALSVSNKATVLSAPKIVCLNNQTSNIRITTNSNYIRSTQTVVTTTDSTQERDITQEIGEIPEGIVLEVTPNISSDNKTVLLTVHPSIIELVQMDTVESDDTVTQLPTITQRSLDTSISLENGGTLVMGGLMKSTKQDRKQGTPGLRNLPVLGALFRTNNKYDERRNLVIFITARILNSRGDMIRSETFDFTDSPSLVPGIPSYVDQIPARKENASSAEIMQEK